MSNVEYFRHYFESENNYPRKCHLKGAEVSGLTSRCCPLRRSGMSLPVHGAPAEPVFLW